MAATAVVPLHLRTCKYHTVHPDGTYQSHSVLSDVLRSRRKNLNTGHVSPFTDSLPAPEESLHTRVPELLARQAFTGEYVRKYRDEGDCDQPSSTPSPVVIQFDESFIIVWRVSVPIHLKFSPPLIFQGVTFHPLGGVMVYLRITRMYFRFESPL